MNFKSFFGTNDALYYKVPSKQLYFFIAHQNRCDKKIFNLKQRNVQETNNFLEKISKSSLPFSTYLLYFSKVIAADE
ncbi:hypothetical protein HpCK101_09310 [Helicobacter pylori]